MLKQNPENCFPQFIWLDLYLGELTGIYDLAGLKVAVAGIAYKELTYRKEKEPENIVSKFNHEVHMPLT